MEVFYDGQWGYVCDDGWIEVNGDVICHILGYGDAISNRTSYYSSDVNYRLNYINCIGGEDTLLDCSYWVYMPYSCSSHEHVYISCLPGKLWYVVVFSKPFLSYQLLSTRTKQEWNDGKKYDEN